jgi:hypothetical protein
MREREENCYTLCGVHVQIQVVNLQTRGKCNIKFSIKATLYSIQSIQGDHVGARKAAVAALATYAITLVMAWMPGRKWR